MSRWERQLRRRVRAVYVLPQDRDKPSLAERVALQVRNDATLRGRCACGAVGELRQIDRRVWVEEFAHEPDCPAISPAVPDAASRRPRTTVERGDSRGA